MTGPKPELIIRLGSHAEKEYAMKLARFFDGLIVGANLFEATPGATASLLLSVEAKKAKLYVDPMTYAFGPYIDPDSNELRTDLDWIKSDQARKKDGKRITVRDFKRSYKKLALELGDPIMASTAVQAHQLEDGDVRTIFCRNVATYQLNRIRREFQGDKELSDFAGDAPTPAAVFAPYFYIEPTHTETWLDTNVALMTTSAALGLDVPVHAIVCAAAVHLANPKFRERVVKAAKTSGVGGVWLWFSGFFEERADEVSLRNYATLVEDLAEHTTVYALHGGYYSMALWHKGMQGISHGIGYGEQKDVVPVIGQSTPTVRYYLPSVARRLGVPEIERALSGMGIKSPEDFHKKVCSCAVCVGVVSESIEEFAAFGDMHLSHPMSQRKAQTPAAAKRCRYHFLLSRIRERDEMPRKSIQDIRADLAATATTWGMQPSLASSCDHLPRWSRALV